MNTPQLATIAEVKQYVVEQLTAANIDGLLPQNMPDTILGGFGNYQFDDAGGIPEDLMVVLIMVCVPIMAAAAGTHKLEVPVEELHYNAMAFAMWCSMIYLMRAGLVEVVPPTLQNIFDQEHMMKIKVLQPDFLAPPSPN
jgi:hypothetical protein